MIVKIVNNSPYPLPQYATPFSAGLDLNANIEEPLEIKPLERAIVPTGLFIELPQSYEAQIRPRSGLAAKYGITVANAPGTIDADYRGEIKVILINLSKESYIIKPGERIAQMVVSKFTQVEWAQVETLSETFRGAGGFGSTGLGVKVAKVTISNLTSRKGKPDIVKLYTLYQRLNGICTDSRKVETNNMFFALKGDNFNGNNFVMSALDKGAALAVADDAELVKEAKKKYPRRVLIVDDALKTLQALAKHHRLQFRIPVIALTGTNGKTTTKELINAVLSTKYKVVATEGNLNNDIGVPLTLLRIDKETEVAVIEMGASHPNDIATLTSIVCPSFGLITSIGKAHLQGFGSLEGVMKAKGELYDNLQEFKKIAFVNVDNPLLNKMIEKRPNLQIVPYGIKNSCAEIEPTTSTSPYLTLYVPTLTANDKEQKKVKVSTNLIGSYNAENVLAALSIATHFAIPTPIAIKANASYKPSNHRSQLEKSKYNIIIKDTYNANPTSMSASIESFKSIDSKNSKILILGDMLELGNESQKEHRNILELAAKSGAAEIFLVGGEFSHAYNTLYAKKVSWLKGIKISLFKDVEELADMLHREPLKKRTVLVKGSHGIHLEKIFDLL